MTPFTTLSLSLLFSLFTLSLSLSSDGTLLLSFKYSLLNDPLNSLDSWRYSDATPCSWSGVTCTTPPDPRVTSLVLSNLRLLGSIPPDLGLLDRLQRLDLSNNFLNGSLPDSLFNNSALQVLSLSNNEISGELPEILDGSSGISYLNLSDNAFGGGLKNLTNLKNLKVVSLKGNYFSGEVNSRWDSVEILDLSSNLFNGPLPNDLGGSNLQYLNLSYNRFSGGFPASFAGKVLENATIDVAFNNLTGQIPGSKVLLSQEPGAFAGNLDLCGRPLKNLCIIPSSLSTPPNVSASISPAIAVIPKTVDSNPAAKSSDSAGKVAGDQHSGLKPATIVGITLADFAGVGILGLVFLYLYQLRHKKHRQQTKIDTGNHKNNPPPTTSAAAKGLKTPASSYITINGVSTTKSTNPSSTKCCCLTGEDTEGTASESRTSSETEDNNDPEKRGKNPAQSSGTGGGGRLVVVDGETEMEMETLLKASAYILGASGTSIVYKAVLQDGTAFAVRRLGEVAVNGFKEFEAQVRVIAKIRHPNVVRVRGFYWGSDEKLIISDYISNGSLASSCFKKIGSTPYHLSLEARLKIARGLARGLAHIHDKKFIHGNLKPSNILLTHDLEPVISDLGLASLLHGGATACTTAKPGGSARHFGSKRSMGSIDAAQDGGIGGGVGSVYQAPDALKSLKANPKWDVYSFGVVLLELLTGKVIVERELGQWTPASGLTEDRYWVLRMADVAIRAEVQGKEEAMAGVFKLGFSCASLVSTKRPSMKEALQVLEKNPLFLGQ